MRALALLLVIYLVLLVSSCNMALPKKCPPGSQVKSIRTDLGPIYICEKKSP